MAGYRVEALVGRGATSTVYRAESGRLGFRVALKILNPELAEGEAFRERFVRESRLVAAINHPNVITIYDAGAWEDALYIAMRYVAGGDLRQRIRAGPLASDRAVSILAQVAGGLDAAHARGLVHRDVKPGNVMVDAGPRPDAPEIAYVTDFGLVKHAHSGGRATPTGEFLGTIAYVAPEQIEGTPVDARTDVYSLGCLTFECLTGRVPFERDNDAAVLWAHMSEEPPAVTDSRPDLPSAVDGVVARSMAKDPADRFATCGEFSSELRHELKSGRTPAPRKARKDVSVPPPQDRPRRSWRAAIVAGILGLVLGAAGAAAAILVAGDERESSSATVTTHVTATMTVRAAAENAPPAYIPEIIRSRCKAVRPPTPDFDESFLCQRPERGVEAVRYSHALSGPLLREHLIRRMERVGFPGPEPGRRITVAGSCAAPTLSAVEEWEASGRAGHEPVGRTAFGDSDGIVLCYAGARRATIEWTTKILGVYAQAYGPRYPRLYAWWESEGGPLS